MHVVVGCVDMPMLLLLPVVDAYSDVVVVVAVDVYVCHTVDVPYVVPCVGVAYVVVMLDHGCCCVDVGVVRSCESCCDDVM